MSAISTSELTIPEKLQQLQKAKEAPSPSPENAKIQRVAHYLRDRKNFTKEYSPKLVSFGPIHYGDPKLQSGEQYKKMWAAEYIDSTKISPQELHTKVVQNMETLKPLFDDDLFINNPTFLRYHEHGFGTPEEMISWTLFVDGCALLRILEHAKLDNPEKMNVKVDQLVLVMQDVLLLENQLPFPLLKHLWRIPGKELKETMKELKKTMKEFLRCHHWATKEEHKIPEVEFPDPTHLLGLQRSIILHEPDIKQTKNVPDASTENTHNHGHCLKNILTYNTGKGSKTPNVSTENHEDMVTYRNIKELKVVGIVLKSSKTRSPKDISFSFGWFYSTLKLPEIVVDDTTTTTVLNLIAYEMCPDFQNDYGIRSYVSFLDSLIDHPDDVKALRSKQILLNSLGSDEEVANLFNTLSTDLVPDMRKYVSLRNQIEMHYNDKGRTWLTLGWKTYYSTPWAIIAFHAAIVGLLLTFVQTWYAIHPPKS
ncbi:hypothetical protein PHAVU_004G068600 [Phaseolus vulgaris]|uniref:Uncharacterized protein n=1 Tax=Phaseolus vulgaris TaxID=3885 RepID=V7C347_PHAVU|nr:hypothetical protein PHAVU_004G068600g [Phaseolus vulgaris]ESW23695.1 hypothetical protein PHAVU_004G068600g [Phaseolus vulgaris]